MVLRTQSFTIDSMAKMLAALVFLVGLVWSIGGFAIWASWKLWGQEAIDAMGLATSEEVQRVETAITEIRGQIVVLSRPDEIVHYRDLPRAVAPCRAGEPCAITIFAERDVRALDCRIVPGRTELLVVTGSREYVAGSLSNRPATNLPAAPRALEPTFQLPRGLPPGPATAIIRSYYTDCPWQTGGQPPAIQDSPQFPLEVVR